MKGMENVIYLQNEKEKEQLALKNSEASYKKNIRDLNDYVDSQKMLLEYDQLGKELTEEEAKKNEDDITDETYESNYNYNKMVNDGNKERNLDDIMKNEIDTELGKDMVIDFVTEVKKYVNDDIIGFDFDEIKHKLKIDYKRKKWPSSIVEKAILKIPDIYYLILKNKL